MLTSIIFDLEALIAKCEAQISVLASQMGQLEKSLKILTDFPEKLQPPDQLPTDLTTWKQLNPPGELEPRWDERDTGGRDMHTLKNA